MTVSRYTPALVVGDAPPGRVPRLSWQEFGLVLVAAALTVFFTVRGEPVHLAVVYAAGTTLVPVGLLAVPRALRGYIRSQQLAHTAAVQALTMDQQR